MIALIVIVIFLYFIARAVRGAPRISSSGVEEADNK